MYEKGDYLARITGQLLGESKEKKTPQFVLQFDVIGAYDPSQPDTVFKCEPGDGQMYFYFTPGGIEYVKKDLVALGYNKTSFRFLDPSEPGFHDFTDQEIRVTCLHEVYKSNPREKWRLTGEGGGLSAIKPLDKARTRELDALYGKSLKDAPAAHPASVPEKAHTKPRVPAKSLEEVNAELQAAGADDDDQNPF